MRLALQILRDIAETHSLRSAETNDRDSADAWENVGLLLDGCQAGMADDWRVIVSRQPLGTDTDLAAEITAACHNRLTTAIAAEGGGV